MGVQSRGQLIKLEKASPPRFVVRGSTVEIIEVRYRKGRSKFDNHTFCPTLAVALLPRHRVFYTFAYV